MSEFEKLYNDDIEALQLLESDIRENIEALRTEWNEKLLSYIKNVETSLHIFDNIKNYCSHIVRIFDGSFFVYLSTRISMTNVEKYDDIPRDLKDEFYNFLKEYAKASGIPELIKTADKYINSGAADFVVLNYINGKSTYGKKIQELLHRYNNLPALSDGNYTVLDGVICEEIKSAKKGKLDRRIEGKYSKLLADFNKIKSELNKTIEPINTAVRQYVDFYNRKILYLYSQKNFPEYDNDENALMFNTVNEPEVLNYLHSLEDLYPDDGLYVPSISAVQEHLDKYIIDIFKDEKDENTLYLKAIGYSDLDFKVTGSNVTAPENGYYIEIEIQPTDEYDLAKRLKIPAKCLADNYNKIYVPYSPYLNFNVACVNEIASWIDCYALYKTVISRLNKLFKVFREKGFINYRVYFKPDFNVNKVYDNVSDNVSLKEIEPKPFDIEECLRELNIKADKFFDNKDNIDKVAKKVKEHIKSQISDNTVDFISTQAPLSIHSKLENILTFKGNDVWVSLSLSEIIIAGRNLKLLEQLVKVEETANRIIEYFKGLRVSNINEKAIYNGINSEVLFDEEFGKDFQGFSFGILDDNIITRTLGINNKTSLLNLSKAIYTGGDFIKRIPKKLKKRQVYEKPLGDLLKEFKLLEKNKSYYCCIQICDNSEETVDIINKVTENISNHSSSEIQLSDFSYTIEEALKTFDKAPVKLYVYFDVSYNDNEYSIELSRYPFLHGKPKEIKNTGDSENEEKDTGSSRKGKKIVGDSYYPLDEEDVDTLVKFVALYAIESRSAKS